MPSTPTYALPYPADGDPADVPLDMQELAERIELVFPGKELGYAQITAGVSVTATTDGTANTIVTAPAITFDGATAVLIELCAPYGNTAGTVGAELRNLLFEDGAARALIGYSLNPAAAGYSFPLYLAMRLTPASGSHTYSWRARVNSGTGGVSAGPGTAAGQSPAFIRISRV